MSTNLIAPIWNIPYRRNMFFTGREEVLACLHDSLQRDATAALTQPQGLSGLGGIGKTQTALEYAYRYRHEYQAVLWARADTQGVLISEFVTIAHLLDLPEKDEQDQQRIIEAVMRWLRTHSHWLLILDNIEDLSVIAPFIPLAGRGHLLLTTRARALGGIAQRIEIEKMHPKVGALLLLRRASLITPGSPLGAAHEHDRSQAMEISRVVDGLPLALDQAGAYIKEINCTLSGYLALYRTRSADLLKERSGVDRDYPESVATTWSLSFEKVKQANLAATELLYLCALLYPDAIPEEIIIDGASHLGPILQPVASDLLQLDSALKELLKFSLLHREPDSQTITIHRLVQAVLKNGMQNDTQRQWAERTVRAVNEALPEADFAFWPVYERCILHAQVCATHIEQWQMTFIEAARLLAQSGVYLHLRGQYREGVPLLQHALQICEQTQGAESSETSLCLHQLAELHRDLGDYELADRMYRRTLAIDQQIGSPDPLSRAASLQSYAVLCRIQGRFEEAEAYFQEAQKIAEQVLGDEHPSVGTVLGNLALLYVNRGRYKEAEQFYLRSLAIAEQALGAEHPDTATALNTLAGFYIEQEQYAQARPLLERGLAIREKVSGPKHPHTGSALNNLAELYQAEGKYELAEQFYQRALAIAEQVQGSEHPDTASALNNLGFLYKIWGKHELAEQFYQKALAIREHVLGLEHMETATGYHNLAGLYLALSRYDEAEQFYQKALAIRERVLGPEHPDTGATLNNLAMLYADQEKYEQAEQLYQRALLICETVFGPEHHTMARMLSNLAETRFFQHDYEEAQDLFQRAMAIDEKTVGYESREVATDLYCLATVFHAQDHYEQAKRYYEDTIALCERVLEPTHPDMQMVRDAYATLLTRDRDDRYGAIQDPSLS